MKENNSNDISMREMYEGIDYDLNTYVTEQGGEHLTVIDRGFDNGSTLFAIHEFTEGIRKKDELGFKVIKNEKGTRVIDLALAKYYRQFPHWLDTLFQYRPKAYFNTPNPYYRNYPEYTFSAEVDTFFASCIELNLLQETFRNPAENYVPGIAFAELYNSLILRIREKTRSSEFKQSLNARENNSKRNLKSYSAYFNSVLRKWSRLLVLRLDGYFPYSPTEQVSAVAAHQARKRFLNNIRHNELFKGLIGVIWKLEYGCHGHGESGCGRGHHFHFIFLFDGRVRQKEEWIADEIGKYWVSRITDGLGAYNNCNRDSNKYKRRGIGIINHFDTEKREYFLKHVLGYLTKHDQLLMVCPKGCRSIGRKEMPKARVKMAGRHRKVVPGAFAEQHARV
jgi:hypothetical protein